MLLAWLNLSWIGCDESPRAALCRRTWRMCRKKDVNGKRRTMWRATRAKKRNRRLTVDDSWVCWDVEMLGTGRNHDKQFTPFSLTHTQSHGNFVTPCCPFFSPPRGDTHSSTLTFHVAASQHIPDTHSLYIRCLLLTILFLCCVSWHCRLLSFSSCSLYDITFNM